MSHTAKALLLHCMDFRFVHETVHFMKSQGLIDQYDDVGAAGAVKNLVDPMAPSDPEFIFRHIEIAQRLHHIESVYLLNHRDCGAYGKFYTTPEEEVERHHQDLKKAAAMITEKFPDLSVKSFLATLEAPGKVGFEPVL
jgi:carbonic anhydrase